MAQESNNTGISSLTSVAVSALKSLILMARETGLEPATSGVTGRRSNQLSYSPAGAVAAAPEACRIR